MTFTYDGREFEQFDHPYNGTITNERAVEVPIATAFLHRQSVDDLGLEVGNVLRNYLPAAFAVSPWTIVDRWEIAPGVENLDVFEIEGSYDWIVSVSTIEHVRYPENPWAGAAALLYLRGLLRPGGRMLVTVGLGQNPTLDAFLIDSLTGIGPRSDVLLRERGSTPSDNRWESGWPMSGTPSYGPTHGANAVWIGEW